MIAAVLELGSSLCSIYIRYIHTYSNYALTQKNCQFPTDLLGLGKFSTTLVQEPYGKVGKPVELLSGISGHCEIVSGSRGEQPGRRK